MGKVTIPFYGKIIKRQKISTFNGQDLYECVIAADNKAMIRFSVFKQWLDVYHLHEGRTYEVRLLPRLKNNYQCFYLHSASSPRAYEQKSIEANENKLKNNEEDIRSVHP